MYGGISDTECINHNRLRMTESVFSFAQPVFYGCDLCGFNLKYLQCMLQVLLLGKTNYLYRGC